MLTRSRGRPRVGNVSDDTYGRESREAAGEPPPAGDYGPADAGQHSPAGEDPEDCGEAVDAPDTPPPVALADVSEGESAAATASLEAAAASLAEPADKLHTAMTVGIRMGLVITSTTGPGHGANSYHYRRPFRHLVVGGRRYEVGRAADIAKAGNPSALYRRYFMRMERLRPTELFYDPMGYSWKDGRRVGWIVGDHSDHIHVAF
jgi:hypothetical protein